MTPASTEIPVPGRILDRMHPHRTSYRSMPDPSAAHEVAAQTFSDKQDRAEHVASDQSNLLDNIEGTVELAQELLWLSGPTVVQQCLRPAMAMATCQASGASKPAGIVIEQKGH